MKTALAALLLVVNFSASAMYVNPDGTGQALIFPYFSAQATNGNPFNTYITIAGAARKALPASVLRVRVREGRNGREIANFNLFLKTGDMWAGAIVPTATGAALITRDSSCTDPQIFNDFSAGVPTLEFSSAAYTGANADTYGTDIERLREGYIEVLEMATIPAVPACNAIGSGIGLPDAPAGGVSGTLTVINVLDGTDFTVNADALEDVARVPYYRPAADAYPDWNALEISKSSAFMQDGKLYVSTWNDGIGALDAAIMRTTVGNEIILDEPTASSTDWVLTQPTRRFHVAATVTPPYAGALLQGRDIPVNIDFATREGAATKYVDGCGFTCPPNTVEKDIRVRWASTVLAFRPAGAPAVAGISDALGSRNSWGVPLPAGVRNGSAKVFFGGFVGAPGLTFNASATRLEDGAITVAGYQLTGLPVLGFMVRTFRNGTLTCTGASCQGNYGGSFPHKFTRSLQ